MSREHLSQHHKKMSEPEAFCCVHGRKCKLSYKQCGESPPGMRFNCSGISCTDWSRMGHGRGWLGPTALPFLAFALERLLLCEEIFLVENVACFDHDYMAGLFPEYTMEVLRTCPVKLGVPISRDRVFLAFVRKETTTWNKEAQRAGLQELYDATFRRRIVMVGDELLRAPDRAVAEHVSSLAHRRGLPPLRKSGRAWSTWLVLRPGLQRRIAAHEQQVEDDFGRRRPAAVSNVSQTLQFSRTTTHVVPPLLRNTLLWSHRRQRLALPGEHLELQGYQIFPHAQAEEGEGDGLTWHSKTLLAAGPAGRRLAGNGMNLLCLASVLAFVFATTEPLKAEPLKAEPLKAEPLKAEPLKAEPLKAEPL